MPLPPHATLVDQVPLDPLPSPVVYPTTPPLHRLHFTDGISFRVAVFTIVKRPPNVPLEVEEEEQVEDGEDKC